MLIAHISDLHIAGWGKKAYGIAPTAESLACCVDHINQLKPEPDLVLVTGDITYSGLLEEVERAASLLGELRYPFYVIPGNHDDLSTLWSVFGGQACPVMDQGFINYVIEGYPIRFIGIDSTVPGEPGGEICDVRAAWLDERLSEVKEQPTIIFTHHPPVKCGVLETDEDGFIGADLLGAVVEKYPNIERILCGHIHLTTHVRWRGTVVSTAA
ncbi:MAG: phosphodiesterase, partial [Desulfuromusa sp.]|nr:phosphodiesterase [Desulfuromusa sp.]